MIVTNFLIYNSIYQRSDRKVNFTALAPHAAKKSVLPVELQARLEHFARKYNFAQTKPVQVGLKRAIDIAGASLGAILTTPLMAASALALKLESREPLIFRQNRVGRMGREFTMFKFKSIKGAPVTEVLDSVKELKITRLGRFLRRYSLDELPQFWNILKGDMSLIGPRPCPLEYDEKLFNITPDSVRRYVVKPGASLGSLRTRERNLDDLIAE